MKKTVSILLAIACLLACITSVHADLPNAEITTEPGASYVEEATPVQGDTQNHFSSSDVAISIRDGEVQLSVIVDGNPLEFLGLLFTSVDTTESSFESKVLLGEFTPTATHNIPFFRICADSESEDACLEITVENIVSGAINRLCKEIDYTDFVNLRLAATHDTEQYLKQFDQEKQREFLAEKLVSLVREPNNYLNAHNIESSTNSIAPLAASSFSFSTKNSSTGVAVANDYLQSLFAGLDSSGYFDCSTQSTTRTMLTQTGWKAYVNKTNGYFYVMYGVQNGSNEYLIQISYGTMQKIVDTGIASAQFDVVGSELLTYNTTQKKATVLQHETGIRMTEGKFALAVDSTSSAYLSRATRMYAFETHSSEMSVGSILKSLYSGLDIVFSLFSRPTNYSGDTTSFYNTTTGAADCVAASGNYIWSAGGKMGVTVDYKGSLSESKVGYEFEFTGNHSL